MSVDYKMFVAMDENNLIGKNGRAPWNLGKHTKRFKGLTEGKAILMGRKTFECLGNKPLAKRVNIVMSRDPNYKAPQYVYVVHSLEEVDELAEKNNIGEIFVIGGAELYRLYFMKVSRLYITKVKDKIEPGKDSAYFDWNAGADVYKHRMWIELNKDEYEKDEENTHDFELLEMEPYE